MAADVRRRRGKDFVEDGYGGFVVRRQRRADALSGCGDNLLVVLPRWLAGGGGSVVSRFTFFLFSQKQKLFWISDW